MVEKYMMDDGKNIIFIGQYMEIYIPEYYFESQLAQNQGTAIKTFGLLNTAVFDSSNKELLRDIINLPTTIFLYPSDIEDRSLSFNGDEPTKYRVAKFYKNDTIMPNSIQQDSSNIESFVQLMCAGKLDSSVPYNKIIEIWEKNLELNNIRLNVSDIILGIIISEIYRDKSNADRKFARVIGKDPSVSQTAYRTANIREICSRNSTFAALTFEDMDAMITTSLNMKNYGKKQVESPIEKIIKM